MIGLPICPIKLNLLVDYDGNDKDAVFKRCKISAVGYKPLFDMGVILERRNRNFFVKIIQKNR